MASADMKQIYTFLFVNMLAAIATILSWGARERGLCWLEAEAPVQGKGSPW